MSSVAAWHNSLALLTRYFSLDRKKPFLCREQIKQLRKEPASELCLQSRISKIRRFWERLGQIHGSKEKEQIWSWCRWLENRGRWGCSGAEMCQQCLMPPGLRAKPNRQAGAQDGSLRCEWLLLWEDPKNPSEVDCMAGQKAWIKPGKYHFKLLYLIIY